MKQVRKSCLQGFKKIVIVFVGIEEIYFSLVTYSESYFKQEILFSKILFAEVQHCV